MGNESSKLNSDIKNYLNEINLKIINILNDRFNILLFIVILLDQIIYRLIGNCESIRTLEWHNKTEKFNIPTKFSAQIIVNTKQIYVNIEEYYTKENLKSVFNAVLDDIIKYYIGTFETIKIDNKTSAPRLINF